MSLLFLLLTGTFNARAQAGNFIYLVDETSITDVEIIEINSKKIRYRNKSGRDLSLNTRQVLMAFNAAGDYVVFPRQSEDFGAFTKSTKSSAQVDMIITLTAAAIPGIINTEDAMQVDYLDLIGNKPDTKMATAEIAAIIYKDGSHRLFTSPSQASSILERISDKISQNRQLDYPGPQQSAAGVEVQNKPSQGSMLASAHKAAETNKEPLPAQLSADVEENASVADPVATTPKAASAAVEAAAAITVDHELYSRKALQKTKDLGTYLAIISNKNTLLIEANKALELAVGLFINEDAQVEVSGKTGRSRHKIRAYLNRLKLLKYDRVDVEWTEISYVSELKKGVDGNYYGIITLQQKFSGFMDNELVYSDVTEKNIEVVLKGYQKEVNGEVQDLWDVFLSDIGVVVTNIN